MTARLALPMLALFAAAVAPSLASAGSVAAPAAGPGVKVLSSTSNKAGTRVAVRVAWDRALIARAGKAERFTLRLLTHSSSGRTVKLAELTRARTSAATETATLRLTARNARLLRSARRATVTATQQYDSPADADKRFEHNRVALRTVAGKAGGLVIKACSTTAITAGANLSGCNLPGAALANADLSGVNFSYANLQGGTLAGAKLVTTDLTGTNLIDVALDNAAWPAAEQGALTLPVDGADIVSEIGKAKSRVDVVSYTFGGPDIVGQASKPGALMTAVRKGVDVRIILNSGNKGCKSLSPADQQACAAQSSFDGTYAIQASLKWAQQNPLPASQGGTGSGGDFIVQFSSQNFQITHQKSILIDMVGADGKPNIGANSLALVSTGNLGTYGWGDSYKNPSYLTNPAAGCTTASAPCDDDWSARDFTILVEDQALLARIADVYVSDANCETWATSPVYSKLSGSTMADTWANGTLLADGSTYPSMGSTAFYGGDKINPGLQAAPQGNSRERTLKLIGSAGKTLIVYNEEMADPDVMNALVAASKKKVDVQVVMASSICATSSTKTPCVPGQPVPSGYFDYLTKNGVKVTLLNSQKGLYIHAKAIVADGVDGFIGSENFGYGSMNYNRELGLMLTNRADPTKVASGLPSLQSVEAISKIESAFLADSQPGPNTYLYSSAKVYPAASPMPPVPSVWPQNGGGTAFTDFNMACGPLPVRPAAN